jgi:hypothetical protein
MCRPSPTERSPPILSVTTNSAAITTVSATTTLSVTTNVSATATMSATTAYLSVVANHMSLTEPGSQK